MHYTKSMPAASKIAVSMLFDGLHIWDVAQLAETAAWPSFDQPKPPHVYRAVS
jgi:hypothetical protein